MFLDGRDSSNGIDSPVQDESVFLAHRRGAMRVTVRVRPNLPRDGVPEPMDIESITGFDRVFGPDSSQQQIFMDSVLPLVEALVNGHDACLLAFGQTGAGKTFTMIGAGGGVRRATQDGAVPLAVTEVFRSVTRLETEAMARGEAVRYQIRASFIEISREQCFDLLVDDRACLRLREADGVIYPEGAKEVAICTSAQLLSVVAHGAARRMTAATGVHEHSSRSHAILTLILEKRERLAGANAHSAARVRRQVSVLHMADLAGAEGMDRAFGGKADADGIATNLSLHVLGRVINAIASRETHVPFRDSTLTRVLQNALAGRCRAQMLVCVSPAGADSATTDRVLGYARAARALVGRVRMRVTECADADDVMAGDVEDADLTLQRRAVRIPVAGFGEVFARVAGDSTLPLCLYVHGSGSHNSSMFWRDLVLDVAERLRQRQCRGGALYHVAVDCPGYGRSPGDRQTIRSYPGAFLTALVRACGHRRAAVLVGSSQGCCAVFNAVLECPRLTDRIAVCHPVGHAVDRYTAIRQPSLLIFDTEDDGHPVSVGRRMRHALPRPYYHEFSASVHGDWERRHMGEEVVALLQEPSPYPPSCGRALPDLARLAGGLRAFSEPLEQEIKPWAAPVTSSAQSSACEQAVAPQMMPPQNSWPAEDDVPTGTTRAPAVSELFSDGEDTDEDDAAAAATTAAEVAASCELCETTCALHGGSLGSQPVRCAL